MLNLDCHMTTGIRHPMKTELTKMVMVCEKSLLSTVSLQALWGAYDKFPDIFLYAHFYW